jgi:hypothetical protein
MSATIPKTRNAKAATRDFVRTFLVGFGCLAPLPLAIVALTAAGGPTGFFCGLLLAVWGACVGRHLYDAVRDGVWFYSQARATSTWTRT